MQPFDWYAWVILPVLVFASRVADVTLGTLRIIFTSRGKRNIAPFLGFVEVFIWIVIVSQIVQNAHSVTAYLGYAAGFATGTYVGMLVEERMAMGTLVLRIILVKGANKLISALHGSGFGVTSVSGKGAQGPVRLLYTIVQRKDLEVVTNIIHENCPGAFFSIEEVRASEMGIFPRAQVAGVTTRGRKGK